MWGLRHIVTNLLQPNVTQYLDIYAQSGIHACDDASLKKESESEIVALQNGAQVLKYFFGYAPKLFIEKKSMKIS